jgi:sugar/nucleoside kinase (ribokinase family)
MEASVVVAGHVCIDIIPEIGRDFELLPGRLVEIGTAVTATGGAVSNTGVALHLLGIPATLMGKVSSRFSKATTSDWAPV